MDLEKQTGLVAQHRSDSVSSGDPTVATDSTAPVSTTAAEKASTNPIDNEKAAPSDATTSERNIHRQPSTTRFEALAAPDYRGAGDGLTDLKPKRTFSRREKTSEGESAHPFGADLTRSRTELHLERFLSQKGKDVVIVHWEGEDDKENPANLSNGYKVYLTLISALLVLNSTFTSSCPSGIVPEMVRYFGFSQEVGILTISLWVAGYCLGPLLWGPLSERIGRRPVFLISIFGYTIWNVACALSRNTAQILVFRFLGGTFGAAPLTNSGGVIADTIGPRMRGVALASFSVAPFAGPALGPIVSGAIAVTNTDWRWVYWVCAMFSGSCFVLVYFTLQETYAPIILRNKARRIRKETGKDIYKAPLELHPLELKSLAHDTLLFPFIMLAQEPILVALGLYLSFVYGLIYLQFESYPIIFQEIRGFNALIGGVMFLPLFLGGVAATIFYIIFINPRYVKKVDEYAKKGERVPPEERFGIVCLAAPCLVLSFIWIGWSGYKPEVSFWSPMMAGALLGFAILLIFLGLFNAIVDIYLAKAASALAGNTVMRSAFGAGFPLFAVQMFEKLGVQWASTLLAGLSLLMLPIPFILIKYGPTIRAKSKHAA